MSISQGKPTDHFNAEEWDRIYTARKGSGVVFRRGVELADEISSRLSRPGERWLDIGCGTGHLAAKLSRSGRLVTGVDHDPVMIEYAARMFLNDPATDQLSFVAADACHLPLGDESVDGVVATSLAGCLSFPAQFFQEVYRVLRRGGYAIMTFTNRASVLLKINSYIRRIAPKTGRLNDAAFSFRLYRSDRVAEDLKKIGLTAVEVRYYNFFLNCGDWSLPSGRLAARMEGLNRYKIRRRLGRNFIIVAQKTSTVST
jgi:ubiquinone/menaquinone biosynthesis C-methylase UbiE